MATHAGVEHSGSMLASVPYIWMEPRHVLKGLTPTCVNKNLEKFLALAEATGSFICTRGAGCSLRALRFAPGNKGARRRGGACVLSSPCLVNPQSSPSGPFQWPCHRATASLKVSRSSSSHHDRNKEFISLFKASTTGLIYPALQYGSVLGLRVSKQQN